MNKLKRIYKIHTIEKYENAVPRSSFEELKALEESMMLQGMKEPIVCNPKGEILDGHQRFQICGDRAIEPVYRIMKFDSEDEEYQYVMETNVNRRQLNVFQKVEIFQNLLNFYKERSAQNLRATIDKIKVPWARGGTIIQFSKAIGCAQKTVHAAVYLMENATEEVKTMLRNNTITINQAFNRVKEGKEKNIIPHLNNRTSKRVMCPHCETVMDRKDMISVKKHG